MRCNPEFLELILSAPQTAAIWAPQTNHPRMSCQAKFKLIGWSLSSPKCGYPPLESVISVCLRRDISKLYIIASVWSHPLGRVSKRPEIDQQWNQCFSHSFLDWTFSLWSTTELVYICDSKRVVSWSCQVVFELCQMRPLVWLPRIWGDKYLSSTWRADQTLITVKQTIASRLWSCQLGSQCLSSPKCGWGRVGAVMGRIGCGQRWRSVGRRLLARQQCDFLF